MIVCGRDKVYKNLEKDKLKRLYVDKELDDIDLLDLIKAKKEDNKYLEVNYVTKDRLDEMTEKKHEGIIGEKKDRFIFIILLLFSSCLLFLVASSIGYSLYDEQVIDKLPIIPVTPVEPTPSDEDEEPKQPETPKADVSIVLNYSDVNGNGNGINIINAKSITDTEGKNLIGDGNIFDFTITGTKKNIGVKYYVLLRNVDDSNLEPSKVKVYLTKLNGTVEENIMEPTLFSNLQTKNVNGTNLSSIYSKTFVNGIDKINDSYRLRIWVDENATDYFNKAVKVKVDIYGEEIGN